MGLRRAPVLMLAAGMLPMFVAWRSLAQPADGRAALPDASIAAAPKVAPPTSTPPTSAPIAKPVSHGAFNNSDPVTFTADSVSYDRDHGLVTASGHVEAWQNGHQLRADTVTFDRNTNVAAATGHVQMIDPDGTVVFADYAELTQGMKDGVLRGMRAILAQNGRLVANGARRTDGQVNELSRVIYSTCNLCVKHPTDAPLWQLKARTAVQDLVNKRIEYQDAYLDVFGLPVFYFPYFSHADPSVKRSSGFLVPSIGSTSHLGAFAQVPYYWVLGPSSDITLVPLAATKTGPQIDAVYRRYFNNGRLRINASAAYDDGSFAGHLYTNAQFTYNDTWRYGFDVNLATSEDYLRDFRIAQYAQNVLNTSLYAEGFGQGAYAKVSALSYQGLNSTVASAELPFVLPRYQYDYFGLKDAWGGRFSVDSNDFNVVRRVGTNDERANLSLQWERPGVGIWGDVWSVTARADGVAYNSFDLNQQPNFASVDNATRERIQPTLALRVAMPLVRTFWKTDSLVVEPIAQFIVSPNTGSSAYAQVPNEDSLVPEFTDTELFSLNRFNGLDRQEGGVRANVGLHATLTTQHGMFDGLIGQAYHLHKDDTFPQYVGLGNHVSDYVARVTYTPDRFFDVTARGRFDKNDFKVHFGEAVASMGPQWLRLSGGYLYTLNTPYWLDARPLQGNPNIPRNEGEVAASTRWGRYSASAYARRDLEHAQMEDAGVDAAYEDECFIFDVKFDRRYTSIDNDSGDSTILFQITLKTVGEFGFHG